jgi:hypothetical protein
MASTLYFELTKRVQLRLLWENPDAKNLIITAHGLLPLLEILEPCTVKSKHNLIYHLLRLVNTVNASSQIY